MGNSVAAPFTQSTALSSLLLFHAVPATYTLLPETAIALASEYAMPLGGDNVVGVPFTQSTAFSLPALFASYPATYKLLPETAIALACELVMPLSNVMAAPLFNQYTAVWLVLFDAVPAKYT
jgi:hypothetical protein